MTMYQVADEIHNISLMQERWERFAQTAITNRHYALRALQFNKKT